MSLQIELKDWSGKKVFAHYDVFKVNNEKNNYKITVIGYNGTSGDSLSHHNNMIFSTRDRDNDMWNTGSYSNELTGGWWFNDCRNSNLNGQFKGNTKAYSGIGWIRFKHNLSLKFVEMKMRAQSFLKEKEDEREKWNKFYFARIRETVLSAYLNYFLQNNRPAWTARWTQRFVVKTTLKNIMNWTTWKYISVAFIWVVQRCVSFIDFTFRIN